MPSGKNRRYTVKTLMKQFKGHKGRDRIKPIYEGKKSKLGLCEFLVQIFDQNEKALREDKLTNEAIKALILTEFADYESIVTGFREKRRTINYYRDLYNRGRLTNDFPPPSISYRYNADGLAVENRLGQRLLSTTERLEYARKFFGIHSQLQLVREKRRNGHQQPEDDPGSS